MTVNKLRQQMCQGDQTTSAIKYIRKTGPLPEDNCEYECWSGGCNGVDDCETGMIERRFIR